MEENNLMAARSKKRDRRTVNNDKEIAPCTSTGMEKGKKKRKKGAHVLNTNDDTLNPYISISKSDHDTTLVRLSGARATLCRVLC
jgi:hypothetical protein